MTTARDRRPRSTACWLAVGALALSSAWGCQVDVGGQTLPSPYYLEDDVQYFPPGPEFKLAREAAALNAASAGEMTAPPAVVAPPAAEVLPEQP